MTLAAVVALLIGVVAVLARATEGSWVAPAPFFAALWTPIIFVAAITFEHLDSMLLAALYTLAAVTAVWLGSVLGHAFDPPAGERGPRLECPRFLRLALVASFALGLVEVNTVFEKTGHTIRDILNPAAVLETVVANYSDLLAGAQQGTGEWVIMLVLYVASYLGGVLFALKRSRRDVVLALSAPIMLWFVFALFGSRMSALYGGGFWVGAYLTTAALVAERREVFSPRTLGRTAMLIGVLFLGLSIFTIGARASKEMPEGWRGAFADGFDFPAAMGIWMDQREFVGRDFTFGARSLNKIVAVAGITKEPLPAIAVDFTSSNIYTVFRDVIEDLGTVGSLVFFAGVGWLSRFLFSRALVGKVEVLMPLSLLYACMLTSPAVDIFFYTITTAATVLFAVYAAILYATRRRGGPSAHAVVAGSS